MKTIIIAVLSLFVGTTYAQTDCKPYVPFSVGTKWEITNYSEKGKETGKVAYELVDKVETGNDVTFTIKSIAYDKKGKETLTSEFEAYCKDGKFEFDMAFKLDPSSMQSYQDMETEIDASEFELPSMDATVGTKLKDATFEMKVRANSLTMFTMTVFITERIVDAKEEITTSAGTFNCIRLSQNVFTKMLVKVDASTKEWYAEGVGMVRSESYDKKGNLSGYSELTKLERK